MRKQIFTMMAALCSFAVVHGTNYTVGFSPAGHTSHTTVTAALGAAQAGDSVKIVAGIYKEAELIIKSGVVVVGGYTGADAYSRIYPGAAVSNGEMTILDGNSLVNTAPADKQRVATVEGTLEGCMIRNGHARGNGGGVLVKSTGTVQNCIIKGNVAMNPVSNDALGGGAYLEGGKLINCVVAFNMANNGYGVAGTGDVINNTISANTYAPFAVSVAGSSYEHYKHWRDGASLPSQSPIEYDTQSISITGFQLAQTQTSTSQYAVFAAAMDLELDASTQGVSFSDAALLASLVDPSQSDGATVGTYMNFTTSDILFKNAGKDAYGLQKVGSDYIYYTSRPNETMTFVSWYGALAYSLWIGGTLPTEGQWELAARQNADGSVNDNMYAGSNVLSDVAWYLGAGRVKEVATKQSNGIGLYDMSGNVWEWCADFINVTTHTGNYPDYTTGTVPYNTTTNPIWRIGSDRVVRGGSWNLDNGYMALACRLSNPASGVYDIRGFRPVLVP